MKYHVKYFFKKEYYISLQNRFSLINKISDDIFIFKGNFYFEKFEKEKMNTKNKTNIKQR